MVSYCMTFEKMSLFQKYTKNIIIFYCNLIIFAKFYFNMINALMFKFLGLSKKDKNVLQNTFGLLFKLIYLFQH